MDATSPPKQTANQTAAVSRVMRYRPGWLTWGVWFLTLCLIPLHFAKSNVHFKLFDSAAVYLLTWVFLFLSLLSLFLWYVFQSDYNASMRRVTFWFGCLTVLLCIALVRVQGFTGNMVPTGFRFVWQQPRDFNRTKPIVGVADPNLEPAEVIEDSETDEMPKKQVKTATGIATSITPTPNDFPQFLGPQRNGVLANVSLETDWQINLPIELWRVPVGAGWSAFSVVGNRAVTMEQYGNEEAVTCRELETGKLIWSSVINGRHENVLGGIGPRATPTIHENKVYTLGATGNVLCLDLRDGKTLWSDDLRKRYEVNALNNSLVMSMVEDEMQVAWGHSGSPLMYENLCIVPAGGKTSNNTLVKPKSLIAYDKHSGKVVWEAGETQISYVSPVVMKIHGKDQIVIVNETNVTGHDPVDGKTLWMFPWPGQSNGAANCSQPHDIGNNRIFISKGYGVGAALFEIHDKPETNEQENPLAVTLKLPQSTQIVWENQKILKTKFTNVVILGDSIFGLSDGVLECANKLTGESQWKRGRYGHGQILAVGNVLLIQTEKSGEIVMVAANPKEFQELARCVVLPTASQAWNNLCLVGKKLLVRNADEAVCFELP
jgi:outer membrane protein assembly factor BamB